MTKQDFIHSNFTFQPKEINFFNKTGCGVFLFVSEQQQKTNPECSKYKNQENYLLIMPKATCKEK